MDRDHAARLPRLLANPALWNRLVRLVRCVEGNRFVKVLGRIGD